MTVSALPSASTPPDALVALPERLASASRLLGELAAWLDRADACVAPGVALDESICDRYRAAAGRWPAQPPPTNERLAGLLAGLHDAGAAVRRAARQLESVHEDVCAALEGHAREGR